MKRFLLTISAVLVSASCVLNAQTLTENWAVLPPSSHPKAITIDDAGNIFVANNNSTISKITTDGTVTAAWATMPDFTYPSGMVIDGAGNVYTLNAGDGTISKITAGGILTQAWATLVSGAKPNGITIDGSGNLYTANSGNNTISKITPAGVVTQAWATLASDALPWLIIIDGAGNLYTSNYNNNTISKITSAGVITEAWATLASGSHPIGMIIDASNNFYTTNNGNNTVSKITPGGVVTPDWATLESGASPYVIIKDGEGDFFIANIGNGTISKITTAGVVTQAWVTLAANAQPCGIVLDAAGNMYTADNVNSTVSKILPPIHPDVNGILYVDSSAAAGGDGSSWASAISNLSDALHYARTYAAAWAGDSLRIYVAKGTYLPKYRADNSALAVGDRNDAFVPVNNVQLLGGFPSGGGTRNWVANPTILSGDIGTTGDSTDNTYHVVIFSGDAGNAGLNGMTVSGGNADADVYFRVNGSDIYHNRGGGIYINNHSSPTISNTTISNNSAKAGGGMINYNYCSPTILNTIISNNSAETGGGMSNYTHSSPTISNAMISKNSAYNGSGMYNFQSSPAILNSTISNNLAQTGGGGIYNENSSSPAIHNSIVFGNRLTDASVSNIVNSSTFSNPVFKYSLVGGATSWNTDWGTDGGNNIVTATNPFTDAAGGNYQLVVSSPSINGGSNQLYTDAVGDLSGDKDLAGSARVFNQSSGGIIDMGAYELQRGPIRPDANGVMYVDSSAAPGGDGSSWATALPELSDALKAAEEINNSNAGVVRKIWITKGTYYPLYYPEYTPAGGMTDRDKTFMLVNNVSLFGGFKGTEASYRDLSVLTGSGTILSGDIGERGNNADNAYHVLTGVGDIANNGAPTYIQIFGVAITGGNGNVASSVQIKGRTVYRNEGGGLDCRYGSLSLINCLFYKNSAVNGGAILNAYSINFNKILNCTFSDNADNGGKAIYHYEGAPLWVRNSIVMDGIRNVGLQPDVAYSLIQKMAASSENHTLDGNTDPQFVGAADGDYRLAANSPAINAGDNSSLTEYLDLHNYPRVYDGDNGIVDLGAYEFQGAATLPVKMGLLSGALGKDNQVLLSWHTYSEINNKGFQIQYGADGTHFENGLFEPSKAVGGNSTAPLDYTVNAVVLTGVKYYRLKQMDLNGDITYSNIIRLAGSNNGFSIKAYPNPTHDFINIHLDGVSSPKGQVIIMDLAGRELKRQDIRAADSKIDLSGLAAGVYILKYADEVHDSTIKIIKK